MEEGGKEIQQAEVVCDALVQDRALQSELVVDAARSQCRRAVWEQGAGWVPLSVSRASTETIIHGKPLCAVVRAQGSLS